MATFLDLFEVSTAHPLLLALLDLDITEQQWKEFSTWLESYILRRAVCGWTTKGYNRIFLTLTRALSRDGASLPQLVAALSEQAGESAEWPSDEAFSEDFRTRHAYRTLNNAKIVHVLKRLNETHFDAKMEAIAIEGSLTVEHLMPQAWIEHWPLPDGSTGMELLGDTRN